MIASEVVSRILNGVQVAPTVWKSYGHAHEFCPRYLSTHGGLHGFCARIDKILRFATAAEVAALMGYGNCDSAIWLHLSMQTRWWQGLWDSIVPFVGSCVWCLLGVVSICTVAKLRGGGDPCDVVWRLMLVHKQASISSLDLFLLLFLLISTVRLSYMFRNGFDRRPLFDVF